MKYQEPVCLPAACCPTKRLSRLTLIALLFFTFHTDFVLLLLVAAQRILIFVEACELLVVACGI